MLPIKERFLDSDIILFDEIIKPDNMSEYKALIDAQIAKVVKDGHILYGTYKQELDIPRRGWLNRGMHPAIAETSLEHSWQVKEAASAYCYNKQSDVNESALVPQAETHDDVDITKLDIIPADNFSKEQKIQLERYAMNGLYGNLGNGLGLRKLGQWEEHVSGYTRDVVVFNMLDKSDPEVKAKKIQNVFDEVRTFYKEQHPECQEFLLNKYPNAQSLEQALEGLYVRLGEFREGNKKRVSDPFMRHVLDKVDEYQGADVYREYYDLLSSLPMKEIRDAHK